VLSNGRTTAWSAQGLKHETQLLPCIDVGLCCFQGGILYKHLLKTVALFLCDIGFIWCANLGRKLTTFEVFPTFAFVFNQVNRVHVSMSVYVVFKEEYYTNIYLKLLHCFCVI
jgi:hypothetical protein